MPAKYDDRDALLHAAGLLPPEPIEPTSITRVWTAKGERAALDAFSDDNPDGLLFDALAFLIDADATITPGSPIRDWLDGVRRIRPDRFIEAR